jgi:tRNA (guanine37-N1)-methyltransferase
MSMPETPRRYGAITLFPEMFDSLTRWGITGRAHDQGLWGLSLTNPREFADDRHGTVDDRPYGGGPGMVMQPAVMDRALEASRQQVGGSAKVIALTPQGRVFSDGLARELVSETSLIFVAGRYEGIDERFLEASVDVELSVGDFVVSGGELPAMVVMDALIRLLPGALGHGDSAEEDSFANGVLDCPHYTRPETYRGVDVPAVLLSGDHGAIARWRRAQSLRRTLDRRPDMLSWQALSDEDRMLLEEWKLDE